VALQTFWYILNYTPNLLFLYQPPFTCTRTQTQRPETMFHPSSSSAHNCSDISMHHAASFSSALPTAPTEISRSGFFHDNGCLLALTNVAASAPPPYYICRTTISHSLPLHLQSPVPVTSIATSRSSPSACQLPLPHVPSSPSSSSGDFLESSTGVMRRVFSTGDLQVMRRAQAELLDD
jgi:hypothetical protein